MLVLVLAALVAPVTGLAQDSRLERRKALAPQPVAQAAAPSAALLATITVNSTDDVANGTDGKCTLREAITAANANAPSGAVAGECAAGSGADTIGFAVTGVINLQSVLPDLTSAIVIDGPGASQLTVRRGAGAATNFRIFRVNVPSPGSVTFSGLTISDGRATGAPAPDHGGAITNENTGTVTVLNSVLSNNQASSVGGAISNTSTGTVNVTNSTLSSNVAIFAGGGIYNQSTGAINITDSILNDNFSNTVGSINGRGGAIFNEAAGPVTILRSMLTNNSAAVWGGGISNQAAGTVTVTDSVLSGNTTGGDGGAITNRGNGTINITNSTLSRNKGHTGGAIFNTGTVIINKSSLNTNRGTNLGGAISNIGTGSVLNISNSTLSNNTSPNIFSSDSYQSGGAIWNQGAVNINDSTITGNAAASGGGGINNEPSGTVRLRNSIIALNTANISGPDLFGTIISEGHNLIGNNSGATIAPATGDLIGTPAASIAPRLAPLSNYGGPTETHALLPSSPALDRGNSALTTDQRGLPRPVDLPGVANAATGNASDIGAHEVQLNEFLTVNSLADTNDGVCDAANCTLREAVIAANANADFNLITFIVTGTINLQSALPDLTNGVAITGPGANQLTVRRDANAVTEFRIFNVGLFNTAPVTISGLTLSGGRASGAGSNADGGAIFNFGLGTLNVINSVISNNNAAGFGGGISSFGPLNVTDSTITGNTAQLGSGGIDISGSTARVTNSTISGNVASFGGGLLNLNATLIIERSIIRNNMAQAGSGDGGGIFNFTANLTVTDSTISANSASDSGGGIFNQDGSATLTNSTVSGNSALGGGGLTNLANSGSATMTLVNTTVAFNTAIEPNEGAGIRTRNQGGTQATTNLLNTLVANNTGRNFATVGANASLISLGHNLDSDGTSGFTNGVNGDIVGSLASPINALLAPLGNYGGPTETHALLLGSPAIDAGDNAVISPPFNLLTEQRGFYRGENMHVDIGAVEFRPQDEPRSVFQFSAAIFPVAETAGSVVITVTRVGNTANAATVDFSTGDASNPNVIVPCSTVNGTALSRCDFLTAVGTLQFAPGETSKTFTVFITNDAFQEGTEDAPLTLSNPTGNAILGTQGAATLRITDESPEQTTNPIDDARFFVRQHYLDFLGREPDQAGWDFWTNNITKCTNPANRPAGQTEAQCVDQQRVSTSSAFFLSPEFQATGGFVYQFYKGSLPGVPNYDGGGVGRFPTFLEFIKDVEQVSEGILVNGQISAAVLEANRVKFANDFVQRAEFKARYDGLSNDVYVQALINVTGIQLSAADRTALVNGLNNMTETRATVLRKIVDGSVFISEGNIQYTTSYGKAFIDQEARRKFVLMEYFGYLRRNPDAAGFNFWLGKLNAFNGDFFRAEMVRAFIVSPEYRGRFGQP